MPPQNESLEPAKTGSSIVDSAESSDDLVQTAAAAMLDLSTEEPDLATIHGVRRGLPKDPEDLRSSRAAISEKLVLLEKAPEALDEFSCLLGTPHQESCCVFLAQVFPSFMLAGAGMVVAGLLLDIVQSWQVFIKVPQLFVLVPALLGLKGNLEMTLASRLSTQANLGKTESMVDVFRLACGNMALLQCQSVVVGTLASLYAIATSLVASEDVSMRCGILVVSSSIITASSASLLLGGIMISVVVSSKCCRLNPDNVSIPIAAALGDVITLGLLAFVSAAIFQFLDALPWISLLVSGPLVLLLPVWTYVAYKNQDTRDVLSSGWLPIISAMLISSLSGNILDVAIKKFPNMAAFQPLMNGLGGNLAAVHASRMSTLLHRQRTYRDKSVQGAALNGGASISLSDSTILGASSRRGFILAALVVPGHLVFMNLVSLAKSGTPTTNVGFIVLFCTAGLVQAVYDKGAPLDKCWGFIDGTARPICRPSKDQRPYFSGHKRVHALKYQAVMCANGMICQLDGPFPGHKHDAGILRISGLLDKMEKLVQDQKYVIYGDPAYPLGRFLYKPHRGAVLTQSEVNFNKAMSTVRQAVEWGFGKVIALLFAARAIVGALWRRNLDPDSTAIPYVTALGDLLGTALLALVCWALLGTVG